MDTNQGLKLIQNPNEPDLCSICCRGHSVFQKCDYDELIKIIHVLKGERVSLLSMNRKLSAANVEAVTTAQHFQSVIRNTAPELQRLYKVEARYKKINPDAEDGQVRGGAPEL